MVYDITSPSNERIRRLVRLRERRHRDDERVFVVEGLRLVERAIASGIEPIEVYTDGSLVLPGLDHVVTVDPSALDRASYRKRSDGVIAVFEQFDLSLNRLGPPGSLILCAEAIEKPGNLGGMLRTADAVGADAFIVVGSAVDPFNPNALRSSTGAAFTVPIAMCELGDMVEWLGGIDLVAAAPDSPALYWAEDLTGEVAIIVGAEDEGLSGPALRAANRTVSIPMAGAADSLNASVCLAILAYETLRQRSRHKP